MAVNHGALGIVSWTDPTPQDIKHSSSRFAQSLPKITPFLFDPQGACSRSNYRVGAIDLAMWTTSDETLVLAANTHYVEEEVSWGVLGLEGIRIITIYESGDVAFTLDGFMLGGVASAAFIAKWTTDEGILVLPPGGLDTRVSWDNMCRWGKEISMLEICQRDIY